MSNKRQMNKFFKNIEKTTKDTAQNAILNKTREVDCSKCERKRKVSFKDGKGKCPKCNSKITLDLNLVRNR